MNVHAVVQVIFVGILWLMIMAIIISAKIITAHHAEKHIALNCAKIRRSAPKKKKKQSTYSWF